MDILWLDLETTGLDPASDRILEVAVLRTPSFGGFEVEETFHRVCYFEQDIWSDISYYVQKMHTLNGLWEECKKARFLAQDLDAALCTTFPHGEYFLGGNSVHFDHNFLRVHTPKFASKLSHRHWDMTSVCMFLGNCGIEIERDYSNHRAMADADSSLKSFHAFQKAIAYRV